MCVGWTIFLPILVLLGRFVLDLSANTCQTHHVTLTLEVTALVADAGLRLCTKFEVCRPIGVTYQGYQHPTFGQGVPYPPLFKTQVKHLLIGVTYEGYQYPHFLDWGVPYHPFFRTQVKHLLLSEAICGYQITLKPFSAEAPPRTPSPESSCLVSGEVCRRACRAKPQTLTHLYFFLLICATICFLALFGVAKPWNYYFDVFRNFYFNNYP